MTISDADIQDDAAESMLYLQDRHDPERKVENDYDLISLKVLDDSSNTLDTMDESKELSYYKRGISVYIEMGSSFDTTEKNDDNVKNENSSAQGINYMEPVEESCCCSLLNK